MTQLLKKAFAEAENLPKPEQNTLAKWLLNELTSERRWTETFAQSEDLLDRLADEAIKEYEEGKTQLLNPNKL